MSMIVFILALWLPVRPTMPAPSEVAPVVFTIRNAGFEVEGSFSEVVAEVKLDTLQPGLGFIKAGVKVASLNTGIAARDRHLMKSDYFDVSRFPQMLLESQSIKYLGKGRFEGAFLLTIKGKQKQVSLVFYRNQNLISATLELNRLDFGIGERSWILSDIVKAKLTYPLKP